MGVVVYTLDSYSKDFEKISKLSKKYNVIGYHVFSLETKFGSTAHCRNFAPLYDINEESATGTSNGALACYLHNYGVLRRIYQNPFYVREVGKHLKFKEHWILV